MLLSFLISSMSQTHHPSHSTVASTSWYTDTVVLFPRKLFILNCDILCFVCPGCCGPFPPMAALYLDTFCLCIAFLDINWTSVLLVSLLLLVSLSLTFCLTIFVLNQWLTLFGAFPRSVLLSLLLRCISSGWRLSLSSLSSHVGSDIPQPILSINGESLTFPNLHVDVGVSSSFICF